MNRIIYKLSREISYILIVFVSCTLWIQEEYSRLFFNLILSFGFIVISKSYEKKWAIITPSYIFLFVIMFIDNTICAAYYTNKTTSKLTSMWLGDYYQLYFFITLFVYIIVVIYLVGTKRLSYYALKNDSYGRGLFTISYSRANNGVDFIAVLLMLFIHYSGLFSEVFIPLYIFLVLRIILENKNRIFYIIMLGIIFSIFGREVFGMRYEVIQIVLPILFFFLYTAKKEIGFLRANIYMACVFFAMMLYGIVSEVYKLDHYYGANLDLLFVLTHSFSDFLGRQLYRLFGIWIKTGGYIIYHVQKKGLFYGLTYIKSLSGIFGFPYVSLPVISAVYNRSTYAQPGLLAEGYANFGIIGAVVNLCLIFFFMEFIASKFVKKPTLFTFFISFVPFTKIFLDGGSLNSALYLLILCMIMFAPDFLLKKNKQYTVYEAKIIKLR